MKLFNKQTGALLGEITPAQLALLQSQMVDDSTDDHDYYINESELLNFEEAGADPALIALLRQGLDANGEMDIRWAED